MIFKLAICLWVVLCLTSVQACSPMSEEPPLVQQVHAADVVIHGIVESTFVDTSFDYGAGSNVYTARMLVYCMYKGPRGNVPLYINVTEAGFIPGHCVSTRLEKGSSYIVLLARLNGNQLKPIEMELAPTQENKDEVMKACNINVQYPNEANSNNYRDHEKCPKPVPVSECIENMYEDDDHKDEVHHGRENEDEHFGTDHTHEDHHTEGDDHDHDHDHDGKHSHSDHHLDIVQDVAYDDTVVEDLYKTTENVLRKHKVKTTKSPLTKVTSLKPRDEDVEDDNLFAHQNATDLSHVGNDELGENIHQKETDDGETNDNDVTYEDDKEKHKQETGQGSDGNIMNVNKGETESNGNHREESEEYDEKEQDSNDQDEKESDEDEDGDFNVVVDNNDSEENDGSEDEDGDEDVFVENNDSEENDDNEDENGDLDVVEEDKESEENSDNGKDEERTAEGEGHEHDDHDSDANHDDPEHGEGKDDTGGKGKKEEADAVVGGDGGGSGIKSSVLLHIILSITVLSVWFMY